jgi:hypothetical protein
VCWVVMGGGSAGTKESIPAPADHRRRLKGKDNFAACTRFGGTASLRHSRAEPCDDDRCISIAVYVSIHALVRATPYLWERQKGQKGGAKLAQQA